ELANPAGEPRHEPSIQVGAPFRHAFAAPRPRLCVVQALGLGALKGLFLDKQSLALIPLPRAAPFQHDGGKVGVLSGSSRERRVARRQEREMVEIRTGETKGATIAGKDDHGAPTEIFSAVVTPRLLVGNEDTQVTRGANDRRIFGRHWRLPGLTALACDH